MPVDADASVGDGRQGKPRSTAFLDGDGRFSGLASQGLNGASSFLVAALVARTATVEVFGRFTLTMLCYTLLSMTFRATVGQLLVLSQGPERTEERRGSRRVTIAIGTVAGAAALITQAAGGGDHAVAVGLLVAVGLPVMALQDWYRYVLFADHRARRVVVLDLVWLVAMLVIYAALAGGTSATITDAVGAWVGGAVPSLLIAVAFVGAVHGGSRGWRWFISVRASLQPLMWENLSLIVSAAAVLYLVAWIGGVETVGQFRAGQIALAPAITLCLALQVFALREAAAATAVPEAKRAVLQLPIVGSAGLGAWLVVLLLVPDSLGRELLGDSWSGARSVMVPLGLALAISLATGARLALVKALDSTKLAWHRRGRVFWVEPLLAAVGAHLGGVQGAAWFLVIGQLVVFGSALQPTPRETASK